MQVVLIKRFTSHKATTSINKSGSTPCSTSRWQTPVSPAGTPSTTTTTIAVNYGTFYRLEYSGNGDGSDTVEVGDQIRIAVGVNNNAITFSSYEITISNNNQDITVTGNVGNSSFNQPNNNWSQTKFITINNPFGYPYDITMQ